ncbi:MAG: CPBP family intramembrane metalloprotease [Armatimonadetes bacterium]|nr:CPBP family intramembrane metalloprotease [Armatimonadota bacterium]MDE2206384.1 CPBP family intramembrane metalloprotease [Armatimonadota bacterium]
MNLEAGRSDGGMPTSLVLAAVAWYLVAPQLLAGTAQAVPGVIRAGMWVRLVVAQAAVAGSAAAILMSAPAGRLRPGSRLFGLRPLDGRSLFTVPAAAVGAFVAAGALYAAEHAAGMPQQRTAAIRMVRASHGASLALAVLVICVAAPVIEELFFRGLIYGHLRRRASAGWSTVITSLAFALVHPNIPYSLLPMAAIGAMFCWCRERTGSTWASMCTHGLYNAMALALMVARI